MMTKPHAPLSLRLSVTDACNLRCSYCRPATGKTTTCKEAQLSTQQIITLIEQLHRTVGIQKLRLTGGEPLLRADLPDFVSASVALGIPEVALTTNGQLLARNAKRLKDAGLHRVNVSLDSLRPETFQQLTRGGDLQKTLEGISAAKAMGLTPVKLNTVVMRGINEDEIEELLDYALETECHLRFLEMMPVGVGAGDFEQRYISSESIREQLAARYDFTPLPPTPGGTSRDYRVSNAQGASTCCGFISPVSHPFCQGCHRLRITAEGNMLGCLARRNHIDLKPALQAAIAGDTQPLVTCVEEAFALKTQHHDLAKQGEMAGIGG